MCTFFSWPRGQGCLEVGAASRSSPEVGVGLKGVQTPVGGWTRGRGGLKVKVSLKVEVGLKVGVSLEVRAGL